MTTIRKVPAIYENGKLRLLESVNLKEGQEILVEIPISNLDSVPVPKERILGLNLGAMLMSDDFDAPLSISFT